MLLLKHVDLLLACLEVLLTAFLAQTDRLGAICQWDCLELIILTALKLLQALATDMNFIVLYHDLFFLLGHNLTTRPSMV